MFKNTICYCEAFSLLPTLFLAPEGKERVKTQVTEWEVVAVVCVGATVSSHRPCDGQATTESLGAHREKRASLGPCKTFSLSSKSWRRRGDVRYAAIFHNTRNKNENKQQRKASTLSHCILSPFPFLPVISYNRPLNLTLSLCPVHR